MQTNSWFKNVLNWFKITNDGFYPTSLFKLFATKPEFNDLVSDHEKLIKIFRNPALLKVVALNCDLFSLAELYVYKNDREREDDPILDMFQMPNMMQTQGQWLWDYMLWRQFGTAYLYVESKEISEDNNMYFLNPLKMEFPRSIENKTDQLILSNKKKRELTDFKVKYKYEDGTSMEIPMSNILVFTDLTNGTGNWFKGNSRLEAIYKIIANSESSLDSKNINLKFSSKFLVAGQNKLEDVFSSPMGQEEKDSVEDTMNGNKNVHAIKSMIDIKRFVSDMKNLALDESYQADYFTIGSMFNIPRDVLESYMKSSTFENQEKSTAKHITYSLDPAGKDLTTRLSRFFGYSAKKKDLVLSWDHLPFNQVFEKDRADVANKKVATFEKLIRLGVNLEEANEFCDTKFSELKPKKDDKGNNQGRGGVTGNGNNN